ncbi:MAG: S-adenosylmethionine:tRNA ribosyltransferase-isomerase, partial [Deltaproteobacteria bacterium]|nr:S-adenosylmethionine:tRNA ribosyltransferase-isomerase [Deltaproteobacteria bacterium]
KRTSGGKVEIFVTEFPMNISFPLKLKALLKSHKTVRENEEIAVSGQADIQSTQNPSAVFKTVTALKNMGGGNYEILIKTKEDYDYIFGKCALIPLPPYIKRSVEKTDDVYYQTIYADGSAGFSVAAPTAGLHFNDKTINEIKEKGGIFTPVSLNIGLGTFLPVRTTDIRDHNIHKETYSISKETADAVNNAVKSGNKIILTGTSTVRCMESSAEAEKALHGGAVKINSGRNIETSLYIYPGYKFKITRNLITNFHQPKSTLYIMICALIGIEKTRAVYEEAVKNGYSLFSYGDAMYLHNI